MANNVESLLISSVLVTKDHLTASKHGINYNFFHSYPDEWKFIERYIARHRRTPSRSAFRSQFPKFKIIGNADDVEFFCGEVRKSHATAMIGNSIEEVLADIEDGDIDSAVKKMHVSSTAVESAMHGESHDSDIFTNFDDILDEVKRRKDRADNQGIAGMPTGFPTLDERTGGPQPGQVWIISARLGVGKSNMLTKMACAAAFSGYNVQYDALEGTRAEIAMRVHTFASSREGFETFKNLDLSTGRNLSTRDYKQFLHDLRDTTDGRLHIADTTKGPITPLSIAAQIERNKVDSVFLDYFTLLESAGKKSGEDWKDVGRMSKVIKQTAQQYQVSIIAAAQLNRAAEGLRDPAGADKLAESDSIGRDADAVITMKKLSRHVIQMKLAKFRHGRDGYSWYTHFVPNLGIFREITFDEAQDAIAEDKESDDTELYDSKVPASATRRKKVLVSKKEDSKNGSKKEDSKKGSKS